MQEHDFLLLLDVIEHVKEPERPIGRIRAQFDYSPPTLVLTTPNIAFVVQRHADARPWQGGHPRPYAHAVIHLPLASPAADRCGVPHHGDARRAGAVSKVLRAGALGRAAVAINHLLIRVSKTLSRTIFVVAEGTPSVDFVLQDATRRSARGSPSAAARRPQSRRTRIARRGDPRVRLGRSRPLPGFSSRSTARVCG